MKLKNISKNTIRFADGRTVAPNRVIDVAMDKVNKSLLKKGGSLTKVTDS